MEKGSKPRGKGPKIRGNRHKREKDTKSEDKGCSGLSRDIMACPYLCRGGRRHSAPGAATGTSCGTRRHLEGHGDTLQDTGTSCRTRPRDLGDFGPAGGGRQGHTGRREHREGDRDTRGGGDTMPSGHSSGTMSSHLWGHCHHDTSAHEATRVFPETLPPGYVTSE